MGSIPSDLREIPGRNVARRGRGTHEWDVGWGQARQLMSRHIIAVGYTQAGANFAFARHTHLQGTIMACVAGAGRVLVGNDGVPLQAGQVYRVPAASYHAFWSIGRPWEFVWICYAEDPARPPAVVGSLAVVPGDGTALTTAARALYLEVRGPASPLMLGHLTEVIDIGAKRLLGRDRPDPLAELWAAVEQDLTRPWTLSDLARLAGMSEESLRLAAKEGTGYSPLAQVTALRMRRAAILLAEAGRGVAEVAEQVGYANAFAFSTAFKRWMNMSPAVYQGRRRGLYVFR